MNVTLRKLLLPFAALVALCGVTTPAQASISEISSLGDNKPGCPGFAAEDCRIVLARQTAFQVKVGTTKAITSAPSDGHIVAWTLPLAGVSAANVKKGNSNYGGAPKVSIVILAGLGKSVFKVVSKGPLIDVTKYLGTTPTFALPTAIPIKKGQVVALTVPTWAPILQLGLGADTSWRSSRPLKEAADGNFAAQRALVGKATQASFAGLFQRARLTYSATFVPTPATSSSTSSTTKK